MENDRTDCNECGTSYRTCKALFPRLKHGDFTCFICIDIPEEKEESIKDGNVADAMKYLKGLESE